MSSVDELEIHSAKLDAGEAPNATAEIASYLGRRAIKLVPRGERVSRLDRLDPQLQMARLAGVSAPPDPDDQQQQHDCGDDEDHAADAGAGRALGMGCRGEG